MIPYAVCLLAGCVIGYLVFYFTSRKREKEHVESDSGAVGPEYTYETSSTLHRRGSHNCTPMGFDYDHQQHLSQQDHPFFIQQQHHQYHQQQQQQQQQQHQQQYQQQQYHHDQQQQQQHQQMLYTPPLPRPAFVASQESSPPLQTTSISTQPESEPDPVPTSVPLNSLFPPPLHPPPLHTPKQGSPKPSKNTKGHSPRRRSSSTSSTASSVSTASTASTAVTETPAPSPVLQAVQQPVPSRQDTPDLYFNSTSTPSRSRTSSSASVPPTAASLFNQNKQPAQYPQPQHQVVNAYHPTAQEDPSPPLHLQLDLPLPAQVQPLPNTTPAVNRSFPDSQFVSLDMKDIELVSVIGGGAFGQVWRGMWQGTPVAVKVLSSACQAEVPTSVLQAFRDEIQMLARLRHPNICLFLGACLDPPCRTIVTEIVSRGSLWDALRTPHLFENRGRGDIFHWPWWVIRRVLDGTCRGLVYLHGNQPPIIHRDLKSANLLLDDSFHVKICDFGLARLRDFTCTMTANVGTAQWTAPEVLAGKEYNESADMYSLGIVAWELLTGKCPYEHTSNQVEIAVNVAHHHIRPSLSEHCPLQVRNFIENCWSEHPSSRMSALEALKQLETVIPVI